MNGYIMNLKGRDFLKLIDYTPEEIGYLIDLAAEYKAKNKVRLLPPLNITWDELKTAVAVLLEAMAK